MAPFLTETVSRQVVAISIILTCLCCVFYQEIPFSMRTKFTANTTTSILISFSADNVFGVKRTDQLLFGHVRTMSSEYI